MGWALQMQWLWMEKTRSERPWAGLQIPVYSQTSAMFAIAVEFTVGNGRNALFWTDRWLHGCSLENLAPNVVRCVPIKFRKMRTVNEALQENLWVSDIRNTLGWLGLAEYLQLETRGLKIILDTIGLQKLFCGFYHI